MLSETHRSKTKNQLQIPNKFKQGSISPYITEIQRKKKFKSVNRPQRIKNDSSQKSFRIRQGSTSSLQRHLAHERHISLTKKQQKDPNNSLISRARKIEGKIEERSIGQKQQNQLKEDTIQSKGKSTIVFNELYKKTQTKKLQKQKTNRPFQRSIYKSKATIELNIQPQVSSIKKLSKYQNYAGYTEKSNSKNLNVDQKINIRESKPKQFRKNKYEVNSSVKQNEIIGKIDNLSAKSQNRLIIIQKKQSNSSINRGFDDGTENQMKNWYRQNKARQIEKSIDKSTQKYLEEDLYRRMKSKNDIEVFLSLVKNPSKQRESHQSTVNTSNKRNSIGISSNFGVPGKIKKIAIKNYLQYEFDFNRDQSIAQIDNPSQQQSVNIQKQQQLTFEQQRKKVQLQFFYKQQVNIQWSQDDCKIQL